MDFQLSQEQQDIKRYARDFVRKEITPLVAEYERRAPLRKEEIQALLRRLQPQGYIGGLVPTEYGGAGLDVLTYGVMLEELGYCSLSLAMTAQNQCIATTHLVNHADEHLSRRLIPALLNCEKLICFGITEPDAGSDLTCMATTATLDGDSYIVNGSKAWINGAPFSDLAIVVVVTDRSLGMKGISQLLIEKEVSPYVARELQKLGLRSMPTGDLAFSDCRVPRENLMGQEGSGFKGSLQAIGVGRGTLAVLIVGLMQAALDASVKYARERVQFARPIGSFQLVQGMIADMFVETDMARLLAYRTLDMTAKGIPCVLESSLAKMYASEAAVRVTSQAIQVHGANGLSDEYPVERYFRDARMTTIPDGTTQIHKLLLGRDLLGLSAIR